MGPERQRTRAYKSRTYNFQGLADLTNTMEVGRGSCRRVRMVRLLRIVLVARSSLEKIAHLHDVEEKCRKGSAKDTRWAE